MNALAHDRSISLNWAEKSSERKTEGDVSDNSADFLHRNEVLLSLLSICHPSFSEIITARKRSLRRLFLHRSVSHYFHREGVCPSACWDTLPRTRSRHPPRTDTLWEQNPQAAPSEQTPPAQCMLGNKQQAGGTHPTEMHTC